MALVTFFERHVGARACRVEHEWVMEVVRLAVSTRELRLRLVARTGNGPGRQTRSSRRCAKRTREVEPGLTQHSPRTRVKDFGTALVIVAGVKSMVELIRLLLAAASHPHHVLRQSYPQQPFLRVHAPLPQS